VMQEIPRRDGESEAAWDRRIRTHYIDVCRYLLPACSLANVGMTANARLLEHAIQKLLSSPLKELRDIGSEVKQAALAEVPTLVKYAEKMPYLEKSGASLAAIARSAHGEGASSSWCQLVAWDPEGEDRVLAAALYRYGQGNVNSYFAYVRNLAPEERLELAKTLLAGLGDHEAPLRELEHTSYTFDVIMDQGAYFEVKRHRMMTQSPQNLTADLGYAIPRKIVEAGVENEYREAMESARNLYTRLAEENPNLASYVAPNGFNRRILMTMNLREAFHFCSLRSGPAAHFAVRRVALRIAEQIFARHPALSAFIQLPRNETWQSVTATHFASV